jgi:hypothetical protein
MLTVVGASHGQCHGWTVGKLSTVTMPVIAGSDNTVSLSVLLLLLRPKVNWKYLKSSGQASWS